jgi:hypothetical protein
MTTKLSIMVSQLVVMREFQNNNSDGIIIIEHSHPIHASRAVEIVPWPWGCALKE